MVIRDRLSRKGVHEAQTYPSLPLHCPHSSLRRTAGEKLVWWDDGLGSLFHSSSSYSSLFLTTEERGGIADLVGRRFAELVPLFLFVLLLIPCCGGERGNSLSVWTTVSGAFCPLPLCTPPHYSLRRREGEKRVSCMSHLRWRCPARTRRR